MDYRISRREWLASGAAMAGSLILSKNVYAQNITDADYIPSPENPIRFSSNENPYGISGAARLAMNRSYDKAHLYGSSARRELTELIADIENVPTENILVTAGSSEILNTLALIVGLEGGSILAPDPTFDNNFMKYADRMNVKQIRVPVNDDMAIDLDAMRAAMTDDVKIIYLCNPNNPTPTVLHAEELTDFCREMARRCYVFIDEAYYEYVNDLNYETMVPLAVENENIIVTRTASKIHGFAGVRIGFGFGTVGMLNKIRSKVTGSVSTVSLYGAVASYKDYATQEFVLRKNAEALDIIYEFCDRHDLRYIRSNTNFTYIETGIEAKEVGTRLRKHGILVGRPFQPFTKWCRLSTSTPENMQYLTEVYEKEFIT